MSFNDAIKNSVLEGFSYSDFSTTKIITTLLITFIISLYIFLIYRVTTKNSFYNKGFNVSMAAISMVTAGIVMAMQSNLVISLGMVGALSIVRFRTAIKDSMDLFYLFWSIGIGIMCGASLYELSILVSLAVTIVVVIFSAIPLSFSPYILILKTDREVSEKDIMAVVAKYSKRIHINSKNVSQQGANYIIEIRTKQSGELVDELSKLSGVVDATVMYQDTEIKNV
mgnify:CR=1 FL=1